MASIEWRVCGVRLLEQIIGAFFVFIALFYCEFHSICHKSNRTSASVGVIKQPVKMKVFAVVRVK